MNKSLTVECKIHFDAQGKGARKTLQEGAPKVYPAGRIPRLARLMALALKFDKLIRAGAIENYAALARLGHVTTGRITQILNLLHLAPDIQEAILFLSPTIRGRDPLRLADLQPLAQQMDWTTQRAMWRHLAHAR